MLLYFYVYWFIYPDILRSFRGFLMISLFFSDLSGHSSTNPENLAISNFLLVQSRYLEVALSRKLLSNFLSGPFRVRDSGTRLERKKYTDKNYTNMKKV